MSIIDQSNLTAWGFYEYPDRETGEWFYRRVFGPNGYYCPTVVWSRLRDLHSVRIGEPRRWSHNLLPKTDAMWDALSEIMERNREELYRFSRRRRYHNDVRSDGMATV